jgi:mono/diheme cytochrome c family protein
MMQRLAIQQLENQERICIEQVRTLKLFSIISVLILGLTAALLPSIISANARSSHAQPVADPNATQLYKKYCASCHGNDGRSKTMKSKLRYHARDLTDKNWHGDVSDERIFNVIVNGKGKMPAFGRKISDAEVEELVKKVRAFGA